MSMTWTRERVNSVWLMSEKLLSYAGLFLISTLVAKYIGPEMLGVIALAVSYFQVVQILSQFGSENILIRRLSRNLRSGTALAIMSVTIHATLFLLKSSLVFILNFRNNTLEFILCISVAVAAFFSTIDVLQTYYDTTLNARLNAKINLCGIIIAVILRYTIVELELNLLWLCIPIIVTTFIPFVVRMVIFINTTKSYFPFSATRCNAYLKYLLATGFSMPLANITIALHPRVNIFFISYIYDATAVGLYSVSVMLSVSWSFILTSFITSYFPGIYNEKNEGAALLKIAKLNLFIIITSGIIIVLFATAGKALVLWFYGTEYAQAWQPAIILFLGTMLSSLGYVSSRYIIKYSGYRYLTCKSVATLLFCLPAAWCFINFYGMTGAAYSVILTELLSLNLLNYRFQNGRVFRLHRKTLSLLFIYASKLTLRC